MHPDMIVDDPVRRAGIRTEGTVGMVHFDGCVVPINVKGLFSCDPGHGGRVNQPVQTNVLFFPISRVVTVNDVPIAVHQAPDCQ